MAAEFIDRKVVSGLDRAVLVAREEIAARAFAVTRQYLAVHEVVTEAGGTFAVARVDETTEPGSYHVYFPLRDEPYHCVVAVRPDQGGELRPSWVYMQAAVRVYLGIQSSDVRPEEITAQVGLAPTSAYERGQPLGRSGRTYQAHVWRLEPQADVPGGFDEKLSVLLDRLEPAAGRIATLRPACTVELAVVYEGWRGDPQFGGLHVEANTVRRIAALGAAMDVDLYAFGPPMAEEVPDPDPAS